jgi:broad specificity phosphatase PhoE
VDGLGAESFTAFVERAQAALKRLATLHGSSDVTVVMFGHGQFFQAMRWLIAPGTCVDNATAMRAFRAIDQQDPIHNGDGFVATFDGHSWRLEHAAQMR